MEAK
jgi:hypothetical protein